MYSKLYDKHESDLIFPEYSWDKKETFYISCQSYYPISYLPSNNFQ